MQSFEQYDQGPLAGALFENYVISEIYKKELHTLSDTKLYYIRTYDKNEIDLIIDKKTHKELIEIKKTSTFKPSMIQTLKNKASKTDHCYLLYQGEKDHYSNVSIMSFKDFLEKK